MSFLKSLFTIVYYCSLFKGIFLISGTLIIISSGMHYGWPSPSLPKLLDQNSTISISNDEGSWMAVMPLMGAVLGSLIVGTTIDILGRKRTIMMCTFPFFSAWIMIGYSRSIIVLYLARFLAGVADGWAFTAVPMYMGEIAHPKIRGFLGSSVSVTWIFGILLINIIGSYLSIQVTALVSSFAPILCLLTFSWMPESPYFLLMRGREQDAKRSLQRFRGVQDVEAELARLLAAVKAQTHNTGKFFDLFTVKSNQKAVSIMLILRTAQQLSGTTAITFYTQQIFTEAGDDISSELATIIYFSVQLVLALFSSTIVDKTGRRPLLLISISGSAVALFLIGTYFCIKQCTNIDVSEFSWVPVAALIGFVIIFSLGMQTIPILMLGELFPANVKAFALCMADIYFCIIATIISKFFQIMKDSFGTFVPFYAFTVSCCLGLVCIYFIVPETRGKTLEQIQMFLRGESEKEPNDHQDENKIEEAAVEIK